MSNGIYKLAITPRQPVRVQIRPRGSLKLTLSVGRRGSQGVEGEPGPRGTGVEHLEPRISALEEATDGKVNGVNPLAYYILAKN